ncbi:S8 family serine peptidase [Sporosalibacterium faouarense]|uniref:S8 family serine peptidase n=1 Tax=Sporosalibacterium faouarense TaxID=516123 RepID=UPI00192BB73E|nr:S8 family serine peptidase [Sporosalibacterium faouarense]
MKQHSKKNIKVVLIDSGINTEFCDLGDSVESHLMYKLDSRSNIIESKDRKTTSEHGTIIAMIIKDLCKSVNFISMNILNERLLSDGRILISSFIRAMKLDPDIIHLSLGTEKLRYKFKLKRLMKKARRKGIIVVTALSNNGNDSYPSNDKNVIRVAGAINLHDKEKFFYRNKVFYAPIYLANINGQELLRNKLVKGNSFAAAYITGHICRLMEIYPNLKSEPIRNHFKALGLINKNQLRGSNQWE